MNTSEFPTSINRNSPKHDFPLHNNYANNNNNNSTSSSSNGGLDYHNYPSPGSPGGTGGPPPPPPGSAQQQQQDLTIDGIPNNFPHRRSRASRTFKNPPQPHMCIKEKTIDGKEVFINVLSWTRIANPDNPEAPIPLYGGMKVGKIPPGSPRMPPLVYAVMASPEVLKKAGRKCPDTPERMNLVDLMCEFVEAMNPTLHLSRKPEILKDRDLSGELKDVWSAVQACRDKGRVDSGPPENLVVYTEFGPDTAPSYEQSQQQHQQRHQPQQQQQHLHYQQQDDFQLRLGQTQYDHSSSPSPYEQQTQHLHHHGRHIAGDQPLNYDHFNSHSSNPQQPHKHQQSAIINNSIEPNSEKQHPCDVPDSATTSEQPLNNICTVDDLNRETESLKFSSTPTSGKHSTKSNGLTLPTGTGGDTPSSSSENTAATSPSATTTTAANSESSNPVPVASKQQTSPSSPTQQQPTATVSPTAVTSPAPQKETKNSSSHNFFPMFRSSKSSSNSDKSSSHHHHHSSDKDKDKDKDKDGTTGGGGGGDSTPAPDTPVKTSSKKSGLNFFRRNKSSDSKKEQQPSTPTKQAAASPTQQQQQQQQQQTTAENNKLNLLVDESLMHHHHHHHIEGSNGTGEIIETSSATIVAK